MLLEIAGKVGETVGVEIDDTLIEGDDVDIAGVEEAEGAGASKICKKERKEKKKLGKGALR